MRLIELFINSQAVDLPASTKGLVKYSQARAALSDVAARVGEFSFPFTLPFSRRNAAVFGVDKLHPLGLNKFGYYTDYAYELRTQGRVFGGIFRLTSLKNGYTGTLAGEGLSWARLLGDSRLPALEFPLVDYDGTQLESILAQDCDSTDVQFPLVAFGNFFAPSTKRTLPDGTTEEVPAPPSAVLDYPLSVDDYPPGVYYGNVLRQIFRGIGWQLQCRELDSDFWRAVVHTCAGADVASAWPWGALLKAEQAGTASAFSYYDPDTDNYGNNRAGFFVDQYQEVFFAPLNCALVKAPVRALNAELASYTAPRNGTYSFAWRATLSAGHQAFKQGLGGNLYLDAFRPVGLGLVVRRGGQDYGGADGGLVTNIIGGPPVGYTPGQDRVLTPKRIDAPNGGPQDLAIGATFNETTDVYLEAGDVVQLCTFARRRLLTGAGNNIVTRREFVTDWTGVSFACTHYADDNGVSREQLRPADFLPPLGQKDVVKDFLQRTDSFLVADTSRRVASILSRAELSIAAGPALDLSSLCDVRTVEYLPALGAGVGGFVFSPAANDDEPLAVASDVVTATVGAGDGQQAIGSLYAPVAFRTVYLPSQRMAQVPTCSTKEILAQNRSETQPEIGSQPPRLLRYTGTDSAVQVPFMQRTVALARAAWDGVLCWDGVAGAVASYYAGTIKRALTGHLARVQVPISPALYQSLGPGRKVLLNGASYTTEVVSNWDAADESSLTQVDLSREVQ